jgi:hypothetical protein
VAARAKIHYANVVAGNGSQIRIGISRAHVSNSAVRVNVLEKSWLSYLAETEIDFDCVRGGKTHALPEDACFAGRDCQRAVRCASCLDLFCEARASLLSHSLLERERGTTTESPLIGLAADFV